MLVSELVPGTFMIDDRDYDELLLVISIAIKDDCSDVCWISADFSGKIHAIQHRKYDHAQEVGPHWRVIIGP